MNTIVTGLFGTSGAWRCVAGLVMLAAGGIAARAAELKPVTIANGQFVSDGHRLWINGANTPWHSWNDFGGDFDEAWWDGHLRAVKDSGINAIRVWITCNGNVGIQIDEQGHVSGATDKHWHDLDRLFALLAKHRLYVMATLISFDHFKETNAFHERWRKWIGSDAAIDSYVDNYLVPFLARYGKAPSLWSIDLINEPDWVFENREDGQIPWPRMQSYFARAARAIHQHSPTLVTVGLGSVKYGSDTAKGAQGNKVSDRALQAVLDDPAVHLDFYTTHYYDWNGKIWGPAPYLTPAVYGIPTDKLAIIGEMPAKGTAGKTITEDYQGAFANGWQGMMAWTSNGVDDMGSLTQLGAATRAIHDQHRELVDGPAR
ncbi:MAG TPA: cellulase family glycosylhydrolase [Candidatus Didemnitutus sp.]|nr:cellulase family glycosylhydrolase [Candidatus Didemnitutus sp.]